MKKIIPLFIYLTLLLIILEMSLIGLYFTKSSLYLIAMAIATGGISLVGYGLYQLNNDNRPQSRHNEYHFYYVDNNTYEDELYEQLRKRA